jgi:RND family efflux transporter MFP subunit
VDERSFLRYQRLLREGKVKLPGSTFYVGLPDEKGFPHQATLKSFDDRINPDNGTSQADGSMANPDRLFVPGMFVRINLPFGSPQKGLAIPEEAVLTDQGTKYLFVVTDKDIVRRRDVSLGPLESNMRIIEKGVSADDWIVVGGFKNLMPAAHVKPRIVGDAPKDKKNP